MYETNQLLHGSHLCGIFLLVILYQKSRSFTALTRFDYNLSENAVYMCALPMKQSMCTVLPCTWIRPKTSVTPVQYSK